MNCKPYLELMSAAIDGECTAEERRALEDHLAACPDCAELYRQLCRNAQAARELDCEVPADLKARILSDLPAQEAAPRGRVIRWKRWIPVAAAACLVLVVTLLPRSATMNNNTVDMMAMSAGTAKSNVMDPAAKDEGLTMDGTVNAVENSSPAPQSEDSAPAGSSSAPDPQSGASTGETGAPESSGTSYGTPGTQPPASSQSPAGSQSGDAGTSDVGGETGTGGQEFNGQTGADLDPGSPLTPGQSSGGVIGGGDTYTGDPDRYAFENQQAIRVSWGATPAPGAVVIGSAAQLESYLAQFRSQSYDGEGNELPIAALNDLLRAYPDLFFLNHRLLCVVVESGSGSDRFEIDSLLADRVVVRAIIPEVGTCDMAAWLLVAEVDTMFNAGDRPELVIIH